MIVLMKMKMLKMLDTADRAVDRDRDSDRNEGKLWKCEEARTLEYADVDGLRPSEIEIPRRC